MLKQTYKNITLGLPVDNEHGGEQRALFFILNTFLLKILWACIMWIISHEAQRKMREKQMLGFTAAAQSTVAKSGAIPSVHQPMSG